MPTLEELRDSVRIMGKGESEERLIAILHSQQVWTYYELGALLDLHEIHEEHWHGGKSGFRAWVETKLKTEWQSARRIMLAFRRMNALEVKDEHIAGVCLSKAVVILRAPGTIVKKSNVQDWFDKARGMTFAELKDEIRKAGNLMPKSPKEPREYACIGDWLIASEHAEVIKATKSRLEEMMDRRYAMGTGEGRGEFLADLCHVFMSQMEHESRRGRETRQVAVIRPVEPHNLLKFDTAPSYSEA